MNNTTKYAIVIIAGLIIGCDPGSQIAIQKEMAPKTVNEQVQETVVANAVEEVAGEEQAGGKAGEQDKVPSEKENESADEIAKRQKEELAEKARLAEEARLQSLEDPRYEVWLMERNKNWVRAVVDNVYHDIGLGQVDGKVDPKNYLVTFVSHNKSDKKVVTKYLARITSTRVSDNILYITTSPIPLPKLTPSQKADTKELFEIREFRVFEGEGQDVLLLDTKNRNYEYKYEKPMSLKDNDKKH